MVNSKHSVKLKSTLKIGLCLSSRNMIAKLQQQHQAQMKMKNLLKKLKKNGCEKNEGESLFNIIRNIVREAIKILESNIKELINSNK